MSDTFVLYNYKPSHSAALIFTILFLSATVLHFYLGFKYGTRFFIAFIFGCIFEAGGYAMRSLNANQAPNYAVAPYAGQSLLLLLAPALLAASIYVTLGNIIRRLEGWSHTIIPAKYLSKVFVAGDVLSFLIQSGGGSILTQAKDASKLALGEHMIVVGLIVQIVFFGIFMAISVIFNKRMNEKPTSKSLATKFPWKAYMWVIYVTSGLIMIRSIYRTVEYIQGSTGFFQSHEIFLYVFDSFLMFLVTAIFVVFHPGRFGIDSADSDNDSVMELTGSQR